VRKSESYRKGEKRKKRNKIELTLSGSLVVFAARSLTVYSDRQTDKRRDQNLREKGEKGKGKLLERWWYKLL